LQELYPDKEHVFVYDNTTTHLKRPEGSLSATKMPKGPSAKFFVDVNLRDETGAQVYSKSGTHAKHKIPMMDATFNGQPQPLYSPDDHCNKDAELGYVAFFNSGFKSITPASLAGTSTCMKSNSA
jgi:hypothetical protein